MITPLAIIIFGEGMSALTIQTGEQFRGRRFDVIIWLRTPTRAEWEVVGPTIAAFPLIKQFTAQQTDVLLIKS